MRASTWVEQMTSEHRVMLCEFRSGMKIQMSCPKRIFLEISVSAAIKTCKTVFCQATAILLRKLGE